MCGDPQNMQPAFALGNRDAPSTVALAMLLTMLEPAGVVTVSASVAGPTPPMRTSIVVVPFFPAVMTPLLDTVATRRSPVLHRVERAPNGFPFPLPIAFPAESSAVAVTACVAPCTSVNEVGAMVTAVIVTRSELIVMVSATGRADVVEAIKRIAADGDPAAVIVADCPVAVEATCSDFGADVLHEIISLGSGAPARSNTCAFTCRAYAVPM